MEEQPKEPLDITKMELWQLWKLAYEQLALLSQTQGNLSAIQAEISRRENAEKK